MDRQASDNTYNDQSYQNTQKDNIQKPANFGNATNANNGAPNIRKQTIKNKQILMQYNLVNPNYNSIDSGKYAMNGKNPAQRHSIDCSNDMASLKEKLRKNANAKKWKGRREKVFANSNERDQAIKSPDGYTYVNTRYINKNSGLMRARTNDRNLKIVCIFIIIY